MKKLTKIMALICTFALMLSMLAACDGGGNETEGKADRVNIKVLLKSNKNSQSAWNELIKAYNDGQGAIDGVYVTAKFQTSAATDSNFMASEKYAYNVVYVEDTQDSLQTMLIKRDSKYAPNGYFLNLQSYADADADFKNNTIGIDTLNWWRMTYNVDAAQGSGADKHIIGAGQDLIGAPIGTSVQINAYSTKAFEAVGIHIVSVPEDELDAYNAANGTKLMPHGYAEYKEAPISGMKSSTNLAGETVYKVFNNCIAMNWEEQRVLMKYFTSTWNASSPTSYGFVSEYWFNFGWSVGGDVMGFNGTDYDFTLMDDSANYLVVADSVTVNGNSYNKGEIVRYEDKVNADMNSLVSDGKVYAIASQNDAVKEYVSMNVAKDKTVDTKNGITYYGYEVANPDTGSAENWFTNGTIAMTRTTTDNISKYQGKDYSWVDFCPAEQYREYVGGSTYQKNGQDGFANEYLKVIGETYDGEVYTGELKEVNGTKIVGKQSTAATTAGLAIPACSDPEKYQAAWDFISWVATEGQQYIAKTTTLAPVAQDVLFGDQFANNEELAQGKNFCAAAVMASNAQRGDWGYFESGSWVTDWANDFNKKVRYGTLSMSDFESQQKDAAETALNNMYCIIKGIR